MKKLACRFAVLLTLVAIAGMITPAVAQEVTAAIVGTVTDPSGAPVKGANVKATDTERGTVWSVETSESGTYNLLRLPIGTYGVKITAPGFQTAVQEPFALALNQTARVDVQLKVGKISETVEVTGSAPVLQTESTEVSTVIDSRTVTDLALATRNYVQLTLLSPGAISVDPASMNLGSQTAEEGGRPYINGNREQANNFLLDGVDNNQASDNLPGYAPAPDAIGEFNLITQNASAEFGNYNGGIVNATIKSGTNRFHGDVFEFFRNDVFNANKWENGLPLTGPLPTPKLRWNMFGGTLGGPIIKDKLFFFADYQGGRLDHPAATSAITVLTPAEIGGNFSALCQGGFTNGICNDRGTDPNGNKTLVADQLYNPCTAGTGGNSGTTCSILAPSARTPFPGNIIPTTMLNPVFAALTTNALYPAAASTLSNGFGQAFNTVDQQYNSDQGDIKVDYNASTKDHINARFSKSNQYDPTTNSVALLGNTINEAYLLTGSASWTHTFSLNLLNEARFGKNNIKLNHGLTAFDSSVGSLGNTIGIVNGNPSGVDGLPEFGFAGGSVTNINTGTLSNLGAASVDEQFSSTVTQFDDVLIYTHGRHVIKTGFQMNRYNLNVFYTGNGGELGAELFGNGIGGNYTGTGVNEVVAGQTQLVTSGGDGSADWALGLPEDVGRGASAAPPWHQRDWLFAGFAQDDWRITDTLTLNLGLRYETRTPWIEANNHQSAVNILTGALELPGNDPVPNGVVGSNGFSRGLYNTTYGLPDFQPRFGFAWSPAVWGGKTVVRGAFTISSYLEGTGVNLRDTQNPPYAAPQVETSNVGTGTATYTSDTAFSSATGVNPYVGATLQTWSGTVQPAVADQWNLTVQRELNHETSFQLGYIGQRTTHLMVPEWLSQGDLQANGTVTYPFIGGQNPTGTVIDGVTTTSPTFGPNGFGNVKNTASVGNMNYNALQAVLQKRYGHGLEAQVSYTYEKCMTNDDGYYGSWGTTTQAGPSGNYWQNLYNPNGDYAQCYWDAKNVLSAYAVYELPVGRGKQFGQSLPTAVNAIVGNWSINPIFTWRSGFPLSLYGASNSGTGSPENRPDCDAGVTYPRTTIPGVGMLWFSPNSFSQAPTGSFGNCPAQGPVIGPGYVDADISLQKNFPVSESMKFQFRADFLNAFNHPNFAVPNDTCCASFTNGSLSGGTFGVSSATQDARELQFALKFYW